MNHNSLNDTLLVLTTVLSRFRTYNVAISADIYKMFRAIELAPEDRDLHRIVWRSAPDQPISDFRMTHVMFGVSSSPHLAVRTLQQTATDNQSDHPSASYHVLDSFYVDNLLAGADIDEDALALFRSCCRREGSIYVYGVVVAKRSPNLYQTIY